MRGKVAWAVACLWITAGCGVGEGDRGERLLSSTVDGSVGDTPFTTSHGVSVVLDSGTVRTIIGTTGVSCDDAKDGELLPGGTHVVIEVPDATVGTPSEHFFTFSVVDGTESTGGGSAQGSVEITAVEGDSITMTVSFLDTFDDVDYEVFGDFTAARCP